MNFPIVCDGTGGLEASFAIQGQDSTQHPWPVSGTGTIDDYTSAFLVSGGGNNFQVIPKITLAPGAPTKTVNVTFNLTDSASGIALAPFSLAFDLVAPAAPGQKATQVVLTGGPVIGTGSGLGDPGSATIPVSLS